MENVLRKIRELRLHKNMTLQELSEKSGLSVSFLSQVERGNSSLTITSLQRIAEGIGVPVNTFFESAEDNPAFVVKLKERKPFRLEGSDVTYTRLVGQFPTRNLEPIIVELQPNHDVPDPYSHPGEEFYYVLEGSVYMQVGGKDYLLREGDAIHFPSSLEHRWENLSSSVARVLCVLFPVIFK
jgi:transcriptional regulator with XRE-family HTH domain